MRPRGNQDGDNQEWDVFISYAREDRDDVALPLADSLNMYGLSVWFDEFELSLGDSLLERIDYGLERSKFGITILSRSFFRKKWTRRELAGLATRELQGERTIILPIWHNVTAAEVASFSLPLADRKAVDTSEGIDRIAMQVLQKFVASYPGVELRYALEAIRVRRGSETGCITDVYVFRPDENFLVEVYVRNTGPRVWLASQPSRREWNSLHCGPVRIGTSSPPDHVGLIADPQTWIAVNRPTAISPERVERSGQGVFTFRAVAPDEPGSYVEFFSVVCDGYAWFRGPEIVFRFFVRDE